MSSSGLWSQLKEVWKLYRENKEKTHSITRHLDELIEGEKLKSEQFIHMKQLLQQESERVLQKIKEEDKKTSIGRRNGKWCYKIKGFGNVRKVTNSQ